MQLLDKKKIRINFRQPKYILPAFLYLPLLLVGFAVTSMFGSPEDDKPAQRNDYIQSDLPEANISADLGDKESAIEDQYGKITDSTAMNTVENDRDSVNKKLNYQSRYSDSDIRMLQQQENDQRELKQLRAMQNRVGRRSGGGSFGGFSPSISDNDIARVDRARRDRAIRELGQGSNEGSVDDQLKKIYASYGLDENGNPLPQNTPGTHGSNGAGGQPSGSSEVNGDQDMKEKPAVVTKARSSSSYFHTIRSGSSQSNLITAIIDENVKVVDGSRVRLRLLDDIDIEGITIKKGTYLYAIMSGFSSQRVHGNIQSILVGDEIVRISLAMYDTDGLEGLYVPESSFRETSKELMSAATENSTSMTGGYSSGNTNSLKSWGNQVAQNVSQKVMNSIQRRIQKNRVRLKYGTRVYLINSQSDSYGSSRNRRGRSADE